MRTRTGARTLVEAGDGGRAEGEVGGAGGRGLLGLAAAGRRRRLRADAVLLGVRTAGVGRQGRGAVVAVADGGGWREVRRGGGGGAGGGGGLAAPDRAALHAVPARGEDVPVVFDGVVGAAREEAGDERPFVAVGAVRRQEALLLRLREGTPVDPRVQLVEPPQPAALPCSIHSIRVGQEHEERVEFFCSLSSQRKMHVRI